MKNSMIVLASVVMMLGAGGVSAAVTYQNAVFDWAKTPDNTTPQNAADWFGANWDVATPPNGSTWNVSLKNATGNRYVNVTAPVTVGQLNGTYSGSNISILTGDSTLTLDLKPAGVRVYSSSFISYAPIAWTGEWGILGSTVLKGPFIGDRVTLAGGFEHNMSFYAAESGEKIEQPFSLNTFYQGGANATLTSPRGCLQSQAVTLRVTNGSRFATGVSLPSGFVPVCGATVTSSAFPAGTFLKRDFGGNVFELSAVASTDGDVSVTFAKFEPEVVVRVPVYQRAAADNNKFYLNLCAAAKSYRFEVDSFVASKRDGVPANQYLVMNTSNAGYRPGTWVIHDATTANVDLELCNAHLEFAENGTGVSGFPKGTFRSKNATDMARITVTNGICAVMPCVEEWRGTLVKDGAGTLELGLTNAVEKYTGSVVVEAGTAVFPEGAWVSTLAVSNGATIRVDGTLEPENLFVQPGARVDGVGTLVLSDMETVSKLVCSPSVTVRVKGGGDKPLLEQPEAKVVGTPAFWVDVQAASSLTFKDNDGVNVTRIDDCRKADDPSGDYLFATNVVLTPTLVKDGQQKVSHIYFGSVVKGSTDIAVVRELVWSKPITNMKAIFIVQNNNGGGGQFLGSTARLKAELGGRPSDFVRPASVGWKDPVFYTKNSGVYQLAAMNGDFYQNGHLTDYTQGYLYDGSRTVGTYGQIYVPVVCELYPTLPLAADCFAFDNGAVERNGVKRLCEMIVYTNDLTYAERVQVAGYLMKKWIDCDIDYETLPAKNLGAVDLASAPRLETAANETLVAATVSGDGTLAKTGAGTLYVDDLRAEADIVVAGGKLQVRSMTLPTADDLPANPYFRVDASNRDSLTFASGSDVNVATWKSSSGTLKWTHSGSEPAILKPDQLNGLAMIDFGEAKVTPLSGGSSGAYFSYPNSSKLRSFFLVENTANGGTTLIGSKSTYSQNGIMRGNWYERYSKSQDPDFSKDDPLISTTYGGGIGSRGARVRLNGAVVDDPTASGFSGGNDLVSMVSYVNVASDAFGLNTGHANFVNGGMLGEYVAYERGLNSRDALTVEAYLRKKWFGQDTPGFQSAVAGNVTVASGAVLEVVGTGSLEVSSLSGGGSVLGSVGLSADAGFTLVAEEDGTMAKAATVSGSLDVSSGGVVRVTGAVLALPAGTYTVAEAGSISGSLSNWTVDLGAASKRRTAALSLDGPRILLTIQKLGMLLLVR